MAYSPHPVDLIGPDSVTAKKRLLDGTTVKQEYTLTAMTFLDPATGWFMLYNKKLAKF